MFIALCMPNCAVEGALRAGREGHSQPVGLLDDEQAKATIMEVTPVAAKAGVQGGMTASQGLARCLSLTIKSRARAQEKIAGEILLQHAASLAPEIEATGPGLCTVRLTGRRNGRENVERVVRQLAALELTAQAGLAGTPDLSFLAACLARPVLEVGDAKEFLGPLPIETLRFLKVRRDA